MIFADFNILVRASDEICGRRFCASPPEMGKHSMELWFIIKMLDD